MFKIGLLLLGIDGSAVKHSVEDLSVRCENTQGLLDQKLLELALWFAEHPDSSGFTAKTHRAPSGWISMKRQRPLTTLTDFEEEETDTPQVAKLSSSRFDAGVFGMIDLRVPAVKSTLGVSVYYGERPEEVGVPLVVKHMNDCDEKLARHVPNYFGMSREFLLTQVLSSIAPNVVPTMDWISGLIPLTAANKLDWGFEGLEKENYLDKCIAAGGLVRTLVEHRAGVNADMALDYRASIIRRTKVTPRSRLAMVGYLRSVLSISRKSLELLRTLHSTGIIHGDVHWGNLVFSDRTMELSRPNLSSLQLIDLGMAAIVCGDPDELLSHSNLNGSLLSPWQFVPGAPRGFRDDVFRTIEMTAKWMSFRQLDLHLQEEDGLFSLPVSAQVHLRVRKAHMTYFGTAAGGASYSCFSNALKEGVSARTVSLLSQILGHLLKEVRAIPAFDTPPEYDFIFAQLDQADAVLAAEAALPDIVPPTPKTSMFGRMFGRK